MHFLEPTRLHDAGDPDSIVAVALVDLHLEHGLGVARIDAKSRNYPMLQNSRNAVRSISRKWTKRAAIANRCRRQGITEVAGEFIAEHVVPQMIIRSPRIRTGKFVPMQKRLLQQYRHKADAIVVPTNVCCRGKSGQGQGPSPTSDNDAKSDKLLRSRLGPSWFATVVFGFSRKNTC
jgi:hypothetical protein